MKTESAKFYFVCKLLLSLQGEMKHFLAKIVDLMKEENLFASQGGPIILAQVVSSLYCLR